MILNVGDQVTVTYSTGTGGSILSGTQVHRADQPDEEITLDLPTEEEPAASEGAAETMPDQVADSAA